MKKLVTVMMIAVMVFSFSLTAYAAPSREASATEDENTNTTPNLGLWKVITETHLISPAGDEIFLTDVKVNDDALISLSGKEYALKDVRLGTDGTLIGPNGEVLGHYTLIKSAPGNLTQDAVSGKSPKTGENDAVVYVLGATAVICIYGALIVRKKAMTV